MEADDLNTHMNIAILALTVRTTNSPVHAHVSTSIASTFALAERAVCAGCASMNDQYLYSISKSIRPHISRTKKQHKAITTHDHQLQPSFPFLSHSHSPQARYQTTPPAFYDPPNTSSAPRGRALASTSVPHEPTSPFPEVRFF
jgi:hypothetical protein